MTDFFTCSIKSPQCTDKYSNFFFDSDFPCLCFDVPKASNFTSGGVQNRETKNTTLGTIVTSSQDFKLREKQISPTFFLFSYKQGKIVQFLRELICSAAAHKFLRERKRGSLRICIVLFKARYCTHRWWQIKCCT